MFVNRLVFLARLHRWKGHKCHLSAEIHFLISVIWMQCGCWVCFAVFCWPVCCSYCSRMCSSDVLGGWFLWFHRTLGAFLQGQIGLPPWMLTDPDLLCGWRFWRGRGSALLIVVATDDCRALGSNWVKCFKSMIGQWFVFLQCLTSLAPIGIDEDWCTPVKQRLMNPEGL